jgi:thioredoxin 1
VDSLDDSLVITSADFRKEVLESEQTALVLFSSGWSGLSALMEPKLGRLAATHEGKIRVRKLDFDTNKQLAEEYAVHIVPTVLIFQNGELVDRLSGLISERALGTKLEGTLGAESP